MGSNLKLQPALKVTPQKLKLPMNFFETFPECSPPSTVSSFILNACVGNLCSGRSQFSSPEPTILLACGRNRELWKQPFQACAIDADCVKLGYFSKWLLPACSQSSHFSDRWSRGTKTLNEIAGGLVYRQNQKCRTEILLLK